MITPWGRKREFPAHLNGAGLYIDRRNQDHVVYTTKDGHSGLRLIPNFTPGTAYK